jgi:hypothetical protein
MMNRILKAFLLTCSLASPTAAFSAVEVHTPTDELPLIGTVAVTELFIPGDGTKAVGFFNLYIQEEGTGYQFLFHSEDSSCAVTAGWIKFLSRIRPANVCLREARKPSMKSLKPGERVYVTQHHRAIDGRATFTYYRLP